MLWRARGQCSHRLQTLWETGEQTSSSEQGNALSENYCWCGHDACHRRCTNDEGKVQKMIFLWTVVIGLCGLCCVFFLIILCFFPYLFIYVFIYFDNVACGFIFISFFFFFCKLVAGPEQQEGCCWYQMGLVSQMAFREQLNEVNILISY